MTRKRRFNVASELLDRNTDIRSDKVALYAGNRRITYGAVREGVNRFAGVLKTLGVKPTERVMVALSDTPMFVYAFLGSIQCGAWPVPISTALRERDYEYLLADSGARVLVTVKTSRAARTRSTGFCYRLFADDGLETLMRASSSLEEAFPARETDVAFWLYRSGVTGRPKIIPHRHIDMIHSADTYARNVLRMGEDDLVFSAGRLSLAYGLGNSLAFPFRHGASVALLAGAPTAHAILETVTACKPTLFFGTPAQYLVLLKRMGRALGRAFKPVRLCISAGEALSPAIFHRWKEMTKLEILDGIGSAEAFHIFVSNVPGKVRPGTSGRVVPGYEAKIVDSLGNEVSAGEPGELMVRGESVMKGYWNKPPENNEKMVKGGWFRTGDVYAREDGYFTYRGRGDDMLKMGGVWVSPVEIEHVLLEHNAVHEAAVVGHEVEGLSEPFGYVALRADYRCKQDENLSRELLQFVSDRLPRFKWLRGIYFVDELPKTATGIVERFKLRK